MTSFATLPRGSWRSFASSSRCSEQHLLWAGTLLDQCSSTHQALTQDLFLAAGAADDISLGDISLLPPSVSPVRGHSLLPYRTAKPESLTRVLAVGRNTHAQLGLGFASQEATFGLVRGGLFGAGGIVAVKAGPIQSWVLTADHCGRATNAFAAGGNTLGQMGIRQRQQVGTLPQLEILPQAVEVPTGSSPSSVIASCALGLDHSLVALETRRSNGRKETDILTSGLNTDGQLGRQVGSEEDSCLQVLHSSSFAPALTGLSPGTEWQVAAGGDTCFAWTVESSQSRVWAWGNNEYGQCLVCPDDGHEQLTKPRDITLDVQASIGTDASIRDMVVGGSWVAILDSHGLLWIGGYGLTGPHQNGRLAKISDIPPLSSISGSLDALMMTSHCKRRVFCLGLDSNEGMLGLNRSTSAVGATHYSDDNLLRVPHPQEVDVNKWVAAFGEIQAVSVGGDLSLILVEDGCEPRGVWRGSPSTRVIRAK